MHARVAGAFAVLCVGALLLSVVLGTVSAAAATSSAGAQPPQAKLPDRLLITVRARIKAYASSAYTRNSILAPRKVIFTPGLVNVGTVLLLVSNSDDMYHYFEIAGVSTRRIGPGGKAKLRVTFKRPGIYTVGVSGPDPVDVDGYLKVVK